MTRPLRARIQLHALTHNLARVRRLAPASRVMAVVKADGYGHGLGPVAGALADADAFGVTTLDEALALRAALPAARVVLLEGHFHRDELGVVMEHGLDLVVHQARQVEELEAVTAAAGLGVWLKVDTGMSRLGFAPAEVACHWQRLRDAPAVADDIVFMTHLACADDRDDPMSVGQQMRLVEARGELPGACSIANSAGIAGWPDSHHEWVRPGIMLYGVSPLQGVTAAGLGLVPAMALESRLIEVRHCRAGATVGYGATFRCPEAMPVGVVAAGYGDGYPRHAPSGTPVLVDGHRVPLAGRVSMDMITVDLRTRPHTRIGDPVELWGPGLPVAEVAGAAGTIAYELLCGVAPRVPREYVE
ncbi:MAG: alanine racemase [Gammaproteobacteria bacterium]|nr:alanine racemase [Gammaproteobacteria bacterium]